VDKAASVASVATGVKFVPPEVLMIVVLAVLVLATGAVVVLVISVVFAIVFVAGGTAVAATPEVPLGAPTATALVPVHK
jgi:uncharacterized membrane protein YccC